MGALAGTFCLESVERTVSVYPYSVLHRGPALTVSFVHKDICLAFGKYVS